MTSLRWTAVMSSRWVVTILRIRLCKTTVVPSLGWGMGLLLPGEGELLIVQEDRKRAHLPYEWVPGASFICSAKETTLGLNKPEVIPQIFPVYSKFPVIFEKVPPEFTWLFP